MKNLKSKYNKLSVVPNTLSSHYRSNRKRWYVSVVCDCGIRKTVNAQDLTVGKIKSCGCLTLINSIKRIKKVNEQLKYTKQYPGLTHGDYGKRFHTIYRGMLSRCNNQNSEKYHRYGGRGIKVEWSSYDEFKTDMFSSYNRHVDKFGLGETTLDRINNDGNYNKENCRWSTRREQSNNTIRNHFLTKDGVTLSVTEWSRKLGIKRSTINSRIHSQKLTDVNKILRI